MAACLVTGNPGSGKSTAAQDLRRRGSRAIDPDYDPELSYWESDAGIRVLLAEGPPDPDRGWLKSHRRVRNPTTLQEVLSQHDGPTFVCGIAFNIDQVRDVFTRIVLLRSDGATQEARLGTYDQSNHREGLGHNATRSARDAPPLRHRSSA